MISGIFGAVLTPTFLCGGTGGRYSFCELLSVVPNTPCGGSGGGMSCSMLIKSRGNLSRR